MMTTQQALEMLRERLDQLLVGRTAEPNLAAEEMPAGFDDLALRVNRLSRDLQEIKRFSADISQGRLDVPGPARDNYLSGSLKEIHSQFNTLCYNMEQLIKGNMVSKLNLPGDFFTWYNLLIEKVSQTFGMIGADKSDWSGSVSSWRYHQILSAINKLKIQILETDSSGKVLFMNPPAKDALGELDRLPYGKSNGSEGPIIAYLSAFAERVSQIDAGSLMFEDFPVLHEIYDDQTGAWFKVTSDVLNLTDGSVGHLHMIDDISDWKKTEKQLTASATIDSLTSAYNRKAGIQKLGELIRLRFDRKNCAAFIDVDGLKAINDQYGHTEGDFVIKSIAEILLTCVRESDWVIRYGGDEFLILFLNSDVDDAQKVVDRMYRRLASANVQIMKPYELSFSVGLAPIGPEVEGVSALISVIDRNMYENKQARKRQRNTAGSADDSL